MRKELTWMVLVAVCRYMQTFTAMAQLMGGPVIGRVCDKYGGRLTMVISQLAAASSYATMAIAWSVPTLLFSQVFVVGMHAMHVAQAITSDVTGEEHRAVAMGRLSLSYAIGMVLGGPLLSLLSTRLGYTVVLCVASAISVATVPMTMLFLPAGRQLRGGTDAVATSNSLNIRRIVQLFRLPGIVELTLYQIFLGVSLAVFRVSFAQLGTSTLSLQPADLGLIHSVAGMLSVIGNTIAVPLILRRASERQATIGLTAVNAVSLATFAMVSSKLEMLVMMVPQGLASASVYTILTSVQSKMVPAEDSGTSIGLSHATRAFCQLVAPMTAAVTIAMAQRDDSPLAPTSAIAMLTAGLTWIAVILLLVTKIGLREREKKE